MKFKNYFNNLEKYWSANFLALLSSTFFLSFILWGLVSLVGLSFETTNFSEYIEIVERDFPIYYSIGPMLFFPFSCFLSICIFIFYILTIILKKKWCILVSIFFIIIVLSLYFRVIYVSSALVGFFIIPLCFLITIIGVLISIGIYLILLLLELIPKFRIPQSFVFQNSIYKKYIQIFYWLYFIMIFLIIYAINYMASYH